jgi:hypothetical protein
MTEGLPRQTQGPFPRAVARSNTCSSTACGCVPNEADRRADQVGLPAQGHLPGARAGQRVAHPDRVKGDDPRRTPRSRRRGPRREARPGRPTT